MAEGRYVHRNGFEPELIQAAFGVPEEFAVGYLGDPAVLSTRLRAGAGRRPLRETVFRDAWGIPAID